MRILEITEYIENKSGLTIYPIQFPTELEQAIKVMIIASSDEGAGVKDITIEVMTKALHPADAEGLAYKVIEAIGAITDEDFLDYQIILCRSMNEPDYEGETKAGAYVFSCDFQLLVSKVGE